MPTNESFQGVSNCYVFKSRLQEYAQKAGMSTPVYDTIREGPPHEPYFRSSVFVNDFKYDSLPGFFNRKAAEQSAAEIALLELAKSEDFDQRISQPVHETGLCKNLLQEYAQKMNYAIPLYQCERDEARGRTTLYQCSIEIGGIKYIGAAAKTKKEAEIKAARTALIAIQTFNSESADSNNGNGNRNKPIETSHLTVVPSRKRQVDRIVEDSPSPAPKKAKRGAKTRKKSSKGSFGRKKMVKAPEGPSSPFMAVSGSLNQSGNGTLVSTIPTEQVGPAGKDLNSNSNGVSDVYVAKLNNGSSSNMNTDGGIENGSSFVANNLFSQSEL